MFVKQNSDPPGTDLPNPDPCAPDPDRSARCGANPRTAVPPLTGLGRQAGVLLLFFVSGAVGLLLQTLWMRELTLLFGSTAWASATALAAFFLGLAAGSAVFGRFCSRLSHPLRIYGLLEVAVGVSASGSLLLLPAFHGIYGWLYESWTLASPGWLRLLKLGLALLLLFPTAFFMGGTLPVLSRFIVRQPARMGRQVPLLYGLNTLGAALGAYAAAFVLPQWVGWRWTQGLAVLLALGVGGLALVLAQRWTPEAPATARTGPRPASAEVPAASAPEPPLGSKPEPVTAPSSATTPARLPASWIAALALLSGFVTLALEVLWTRMFAQVLHNSVYSFAIVLILFLVALALGALVAAWLARLTRAPERLLPWLLTAGGLLVASTPLTFTHLSDGLGYLGIGTDWSGYLTTAFTHVATLLLVPTLVLGILFPYLMRIIEQPGIDVGGSVGRLVALNTLGAIAGALGAGFLLLDWLGLWRSIQLLGALYLAAALLLPRSAQSAPVHAADSSPAPPSLSPLRERLRPRAAILAPVLGLVALLSVLDASRLPVVRVDPLGRGDSLLQFWETGAGTVAVIRRGSALRLKVDNHYTLGGSGGRAHEARQGHIPLLLHPQPRSVFFLGLGTGITAGAALHHAVERVEVAELLPAAITAARLYFAPWNNGLFDDERAQILIEDGRHHLAATRRQYDVIIGDLFVPWKAGVGGLYSLEHFRAVRARLAPGGLFAQWIPLYQISEPLFTSILRTFVEVFPHATLWRGDFLPNGPIVALVGHTTPVPIDPERIAARMAALETQGVSATERDSPNLTLPPLFLYYGGNLGVARALFADAPLNTNARPIIELQAPRMQRAQAAGEVDWLRGDPLIALFERLQIAVPPEVDPILANLESEGHAFVRHGLELFRAQLEDNGKRRSAVTVPAANLDALRARIQALKAGKNALDVQLQRLDVDDGPPR